MKDIRRHCRLGAICEDSHERALNYYITSKGFRLDLYLDREKELEAAVEKREERRAKKAAYVEATIFEQRSHEEALVRNTGTAANQEFFAKKYVPTLPNFLIFFTILNKLSVLKSTGKRVCHDPKVGLSTRRRFGRGGSRYPRPSTWGRLSCAKS